jgi:[protein-PII] uridylyltransferase
VARAAANARPLYQALAGECLVPSVRFDASGAPGPTIIDIEAEDRAGLLYALSSTFNELGLNVVLAKVVTEKGAAIDTFYITEADGSAIVDGERQAEIGSALRRAAHKQ